jgi:hypothetical protein
LATPEPAVLTEGLTKRFGAFTAVDHVDRRVGTDLADLWPDVWTRFVFGAGTFTLSVRLFSIERRRRAAREDHR